MRLATPAVAALFLALALSGFARAEGWSVASPDGKVVITVSQAEPGARLTYTVSCDGAAVLETSPLGINRRDAAFTEGLTLVDAGASSAHDSTYALLHGKRREARDHYSTRTLAFRNGNGATIELHLRAYDDGVAFRYRFPGEGGERKTVREESTGFRLPAGSKVWVQPYDEADVYKPGYEAYWQFGVPAGTTSPNRAGWALPLLFSTPSGRWGLITEAYMDGSYGASRLRAEAPGGLYRLRFPDAAEGNGTGAVEPSSRLPWATPWRTVIIGTTPAPIVESTLVENLNPPSKVSDTGWIKPGRVSWSWLFDPDSPQDFARLKPFVDLAAEMGWEYTLVDANWDIMKNGTIHDLIAYAKQKGVGVCLWYNSGGPHNVVTERPRGMMDLRRVRRYEFERLAKWGVKGVKVDFFQSDKSNIMTLYREILEDAADYKIMVNFHGCTLPRGWSRTYPHLMSMEAVRGAENYQFEPKFPAYAPKHNATLPFTRNAVGPMDYTPVMLHDNRNPLVTTAAHEVALSVVFESGLLHFAGGPAEYRELAEVPKTFLKQVPVVWDETRFLQGQPAELLVLARRSGTTWYVAGIDGAGKARTLDLDLAKLGPGPWSATIIEDGAKRPELVGRTQHLDAGGRLKVETRPNGGFVAVLKPER